MSAATKFMYFDCKNACVFGSKVMRNFCLCIANVCVLNANLSKIYAFKLQRCCAFWSNAALSIQLQENLVRLMTSKFMRNLFTFIAKRMRFGSKVTQNFCVLLGKLLRFECKYK